MSHKEASLEVTCMTKVSVGWCLSSDFLEIVHKNQKSAADTFPFARELLQSIAEALNKIMPRTLTTKNFNP